MADLFKKAADAAGITDKVKKVEEVINLPGKTIKQAEDAKKRIEGTVNQGEKTVDQIRELSGNQLTIKIGAKTNEAAAVETRLVVHGFETTKDGKIDLKEAIRLGDFIKGKPGLQGEVRFDEKKNQLVFSKTALETLKSDPAAAKAQAPAAPAPRAVAAPATPAPQAAPAEASAYDKAKAQAAAAIDDGNCAFPWKAEYKTEHCSNVRKVADEKRLEKEQNR